MGTRSRASTSQKRASARALFSAVHLSRSRCARIGLGGSAGGQASSLDMGVVGQGRAEQKSNAYLTADAVQLGALLHRRRWSPGRCGLPREIPEVERGWGREGDDDGAREGLVAADSRLWNSCLLRAAGGSQGCCPLLVFF